MSYVPESRQLRGLSYEVASLYGMPHIGARYRSDNINDTGLTERPATCAACGKVAMTMNRHHEPPKSKGRSFLLCTPMGQFVLKPALIALCGSGTTGCHGMRHSGLLSVRWEWDRDENAERWWNGHWLSHGYTPNSRNLFELGRYVLSGPGVEWEVRG